MTVLSPLRRLGFTVVAVAASATLVTACGSSTDGTPFEATGNGSTVVSAPSVTSDSGDGGGAAGSSSVPSASGPVASASAPVASASSDGGGGSGTTEFCKQLTSLGTNFGGSLSDGQAALKELAGKWEKLAASAPAEIKPDVQTIADYFKSFANGSMPDASKTSEVTTAASNIGKYLSTACI